MKFKTVIIVAIACLALGLVSHDAMAGGRNPASCLLFPYYKTSPDALAVMTITNVGEDTLAVRLVWIDDGNCMPEDQWIELTGGDTFTFIDSAMNPEPTEQGFMYAYVVESIGSTLEEDADCLIGQELIFEIIVESIPGDLSYSINAAPFEALDIVKDGDLHLDGVEYTCAPYKLYFPRFFGQSPPSEAGINANSTLYLINLVGGQHFYQQANVLVYNDNEQAFSSTVFFPCWEDFNMDEVSGATSVQHLLSSNHDPLELWDGNNDPLAPHVKTGWIVIESDWVWNFNTSFVHDDPSLYGVIIEKVEALSAADLPWQVEDPVVNKYAMLWSTSPWGDL